MAEQKGLLYEVRLPDTPMPRVLIDPLRLRQILFNLIGNAIKFTEQGRVAITATLTGGEQPPVLHLTITDTGAGIPADKLPRLFTPFYRAHGQGQFPGSGLGLNIARILCQMMGGGDSRSQPGRRRHPPRDKAAPHARPATPRPDHGNAGAPAPPGSTPPPSAAYPGGR